MKNITLSNIEAHTADAISPKPAPGNGHQPQPPVENLPEVLFISSYPPRECGIATYSQDLLKALNNKFSRSFSLTVCALETGRAVHAYPEEVKYVLDTTDSLRYPALAHTINADKKIEFVLLQHEFGFFQQQNEEDFLQFLHELAKPVIVVFHTVLPRPDEALKIQVGRIAAASAALIVMTKHAAGVLQADYGIPADKIVAIAHGTHLVPHLNKELLKEKYGLRGRKVLSTFGLLSSGKSIETTLDSLPDIIRLNPDVIFLVIGKTHPDVLKSEGEGYRNMLSLKVKTLKLGEHVSFINNYLPLEVLLEYLQLTDIYLFTSKDPNQTVSGTFSYAMSCGCPIISTPIPHAQEVLRADTGIIIDFQNSQQLAAGVNRLMSDENLRIAFGSSTLQRIVPTAWENSAIAHARLLQKIGGQTNGRAVALENPGSIFRQTTYKTRKIDLQYRMPEINLDHVKKMTTDFGIIQFSKINQPDIDSGYTLDDNARALIALCMHYELTGEPSDLPYIRTYLDFIAFCMQPEGYFLNYVDADKKFTSQNYATNLADSNGRAIWALGYLISKSALMPAAFTAIAESVLDRALPRVEAMHSTRAMAFAIKGLYYGNRTKKSPATSGLIRKLANRLLQMYRHESEQKWQWFESYLTYANSILPEALLCAWLETGDGIYNNGS